MNRPITGDSYVFMVPRHFSSTAGRSRGAASSSKALKWVYSSLGNRREL